MPESQHTSSGPIDAVITWVNGDDPVFKAKKAAYLSGGIEKRLDIAGDNRYVAGKEIYWCVGSLLRYAPFLRNIFIVTDGQDPHLEGFVAENFPQASTKITIVGHSVIFRGLEEYLPVFNSRAIEALLWRIPGLSENYIYLNDDFSLAAPVSEGDFFTEEGKIVMYSRKHNALLFRFLHAIRPPRHGHRMESHKACVRRCYEALGYRYFRMSPHVPKAQKVSILRNLYDSRPELFLKTISCRFRHSSQYLADILCFAQAEKDGLLEVRSPKGREILFRTKSHHGDRSYLDKMMSRADSMPELKFLCFNSLNEASAEQSAIIEEWMASRLGLKIAQSHSDQL